MSMRKCIKAMRSVNKAVFWLTMAVFLHIPMLRLRINALFCHTKAVFFANLVRAGLFCARDSTLPCDAGKECGSDFQCRAFFGYRRAKPGNRTSEIRRKGAATLVADVRARSAHFSVWHVGAISASRFVGSATEVAAPLRAPWFFVPGGLGMGKITGHKISLLAGRL